MTRLGYALARAKETAGMSYGEIAAATHSTRGWISNIASGARWPDRRWAECADDALAADGALIRAWDADHAGREHRRRVDQALDVSLAAARELISMPDVADTDRLHGRVASLAESYLWTPPAPVLDDLNPLLTELVRRLREPSLTSDARRELQVAASRASGVLAYAALDLGHPVVAAQHGAVAWQLADRADHDELRAWVRGTQSLICRFGNDYARANALVHDGLRFAHAGNGSAGVRLLAGAAQCAANLGDAATALDLLDQAHRERPADDEIHGLYAFPDAKLAYYGGSSLMWIGDQPRVLERAASSAATAVALWQEKRPELRSLKDEALSLVYRATAFVRLGRVDDAMHAVGPILELPAERRISWLSKRVAQLAELLDAPRYAGSVAAADARDLLLSYDADTSRS
jgi:tetratricopeptide (TPR) repeat protein